MKNILFFVLVVALAAPAAAQYLGNTAPVKSDVPARQTLVRDRQGGDTMADAFLIPGFPFEDTGTTVGYTNDYDEACPYPGSTAPDVVYKLQSTTPTYVAIDMCFSSYDTKIYVYREDFTVVACNDDYYYDDPCGVYTSRIENLAIDPAVKYFLVIDGYGDAAGDYEVHIDEYVPCTVACPAGGWPESEPPLIPDYVDSWNGGCNTSPNHPFQVLDSDESGGRLVCGVSGWYPFEGASYRDTDWYVLHMGSVGTIEIEMDAELPTYFFELSPQDCDAVGVLQQVMAGPCSQAFMTIGGYAFGAPVWFWVGPTTFSPPEGLGNEYDYVFWATGLEPCCLTPIATETRTWGAVKSLYR